MNNKFSIKENIVDILKKEIYAGEIFVSGGKIESVKRIQEKCSNYILPGFIDAHVHIESSMLIPSEFARLAVVHGTVATVSDPHEIANVSGIDGIKYMIENGNQVPFKFYFGAPSCVPATGFETAGKQITAGDIEHLFKDYGLKYLSEMMNFPGVIFNDPEVMKKIDVAKRYNKPIDGHAPGLTGDDLKKYVSAGITTDHEAFTLKEGLEKISLGMKILIREGTAARNFEALHSLITSHNEMVLLCSDDKHPDDLVKGHINLLVKKAIEYGHDLFLVLKTACINPAKHYKLDVGLLKEGDYADFIIAKDLKNFEVLRTYINGELVAEEGETKIKSFKPLAINNFKAFQKTPADFEVKSKNKKIRVIEAIDGQLITNLLVYEPKVNNGMIVSDTENDVLKIAVINRYENTKPSVGFIKNFGLQKGAIASSIAHDSHNIIAVGVSDEDICIGINSIIANEGGISIVNDNEVNILPLPVGGIMSNDDGYSVAESYSKISQFPKQIGCTLKAPFMTLAFMALLVIPSIKLSDKGLFDGNKFQFIDLFVE
jgi:adenine deaminase